MNQARKFNFKTQVEKLNPTSRTDLSNKTLRSILYCIRTLPRGGMYWEIHPPRPERFPKGGDFAPRGPRDLPRAKPEGNLEGRGVQNPRPREISRAEGDVFPNASRLEAVYVHSLSISREVLILWCVFI